MLRALRKEQQQAIALALDEELQAFEGGTAHAQQRLGQGGAGWQPGALGGRRRHAVTGRRWMQLAYRAPSGKLPG